MSESHFYTFEDSRLPYELGDGSQLAEVTLAFEIHGELNAERDNAILVFHALTGSQHLAGFCGSVPGVSNWTDECQTGWWDAFVGPGLALDTNQFAVICANYLGGCYGSTGPSSIDPATNKPYGSTFPKVSLHDMVDTQIALLDHLGIETLHATTGASVGGLMSLSLATRYPERVRNVIPIAAGLRVTALQYLHNFEQSNAIVNDPAFAGGDYYDEPGPQKGLALARMIGHKSFVSLQAMEQRARGEVIRDHPEYYEITHPLESYMWHQGQKFVERFDANTYLVLMKAWQNFELLEATGADSFSELFKRCQDQRYMVFSIDSDVCFYPVEQRHLVQVLKDAGVDTTWITVHSDKGHDSFLLEPALFKPHLRETLGLA